jgi:hypothetical protein
MNIKIFMLSAANDAERDILKDFGAGVQTWLNTVSTDNQPYLDAVRLGRWERLGRFKHCLEYEYAEAYTNCDVAVIFGSWKPREKGTHQVRTSVANLSNTFLCIETPLINRYTDQDNHAWRIGINGYLNRDAHWPELTAAEADRKLEEMGVSWQGWTNNPDGHIVLALQLPGDASLRGSDVNDWALRCVDKIRLVSDRPIVIRNHPLCSQRAFADHEELGRRLLLRGHNHLRFSDGQLVPWSQDLRDAYCTVTYTSGLAIDSILAGVPTVACDPGNFAWGISENDPANIEKLALPNDDIMQHWLRHLSACQWSEKEMRDGTAWQCLLSALDPVK